MKKTVNTDQLAVNLGALFLGGDPSVSLPLARRRFNELSEDSKRYWRRVGVAFDVVGQDLAQLKKRFPEFSKALHGEKNPFKPLPRVMYSFYLDSHALELLKLRATSQKRPVSALVREAIDVYLGG